MTTRLVLIRHGQSEANLQKRLAGQEDYPLTDLGRRQAQCAANALKQTSIDVVYASDLSRAFETAQIVAAPHHLTVTPDRGFREMFVGECEGLLYETLEREYTEVYRIWCEDISHSHFPGGETPAQVMERAQETVNRLVVQHPGKTLCVATHAMWIRCLCTALSGFSVEGLDRFPFAVNASLTYLSYENGQLSLDAYGVQDHLAGLITNDRYVRTAV